MSGQHLDNPGEWTRHALAVWLAAPDKETRLARWLQNYDEAASWGDEPYRWILDSLPPGAAGADMQDELAETIAALLNRQPDAGRVGVHHEQLLYNLLRLASSLHRPSQLWRPLLEMLHRQKLGGDFLGSDLRAALRAALIGNQLDDTLAELWLSMGKKQEQFLPGTPVHGFYGALMLPPYNGGPSPIISQSLALVAQHLEPDRNRRRSRFMEALRSLTTAYPRDEASWDLDLIHMADKDNWPRWTCACVNMFPRFADEGDLGMPVPVARAIAKAFGDPIRRTVWNGCLAAMSLQGASLAYYERFSYEFASGLARMELQTSYRSDGAWEGLLHTTMAASVKWMPRPSPQHSPISFFHLTFPALNARYSPTD